MALAATLLVILVVSCYAAITHYRLYRDEERVNRRLRDLRKLRR